MKKTAFSPLAILDQCSPWPWFPKEVSGYEVSLIGSDLKAIANAGNSRSRSIEQRVSDIKIMSVAPEMLSILELMLTQIANKPMDTLTEAEITLASQWGLMRRRVGGDL